MSKADKTEVMATGAVAVLTSPDGRIFAHACCFEPDDNGDCSMSAMEAVAYGRLAAEFVKLYCHESMDSIHQGTKNRVLSDVVDSGRGYVRMINVSNGAVNGQGMRPGVIKVLSSLDGTVHLYGACFEADIDGYSNWNYHTFKAEERLEVEVVRRLCHEDLHGADSMLRLDLLRRLLGTGKYRLETVTIGYEKDAQ